MRIVNAEGRILYGRVIALCADRGCQVKMPRNVKLASWKKAAEDAVAWVNANTSYNLQLLPRGLEMHAPKLPTLEEL